MPTLLCRQSSLAKLSLVLSKQGSGRVIGGIESNEESGLDWREDKSTLYRIDN